MIGFWIRAAGFSAASAVGLGAFGAHGLKNRVSEYGQQVWKTGAEYHLMHSLALFGVGILAEIYKEDLARVAKLNRVGAFFVGGIVLFSGSLYALALTDIKKLGAITPIGGVLFIGGWIALMFI